MFSTWVIRCLWLTDLQEGDCWFMAAVATITNLKGLIEKICVARDEKVGVYGFVFLRGKNAILAE